MVQKAMMPTANAAASEPPPRLRLKPLSLKMVVDDAYRRCGFLLNQAGGFAPGRGLPIVFPLFQGNPRWKRLIQVSRQRINIRLVHSAQTLEFAIRFFAIQQLQAVLRQSVADAAQVRGREPVVRQRLGWRAKNLRKVGDGVARDRKRQIGLTLASSFDAYLQQRAGIQNRGQRSDPGLVVVLRPKIRQHWIRQMAFHQFRGPQLPILQYFPQRLPAALVTVAAQKLARGGWSSRTRIEQRNIHFALRERSVDEREITDDHGQETKAKAAFGDHEHMRK